MKLNVEKTMVSFDVTLLFPSIPTTRSSLNLDQICSLLDLYLNTTCFTYRGDFDGQKHGGTVGSPVSPIVTNLFMEEVEKKAFNSFSGTACFRYADDTWVKIKSEEVETFAEHINAIDTYSISQK